ncbi:MAG: thiol:disulfide interchange protein [Balneolaceae bacterium]|nr:MAG: thiol:disulfide interchange protein [Balneolaceae bacterium]
MIHKVHTILLTLLILSLSGYAQLAGQAVQTDNAVVELVSEQESIRPGEAFRIGVHMELRDGWYVYYRNPGDSGMPLTVRWTHDPTFRAGDIQWPVPLWIPVAGGLTSYGYYGQVLLMMEAEAPAELTPGSFYTLEAEADWLICEAICIPEYADLTLTLEVTDDEIQYSDIWLPRFNETRNELPVSLPYWKASAKLEGNTIRLSLASDAFTLPEYDEIRYFAKQEAEIENSAPQPFTAEGETITLELRKSIYKTGDPDRLWGVLYSPQGWDEPGRIKGMIVDVPIGESNHGQELPAAASLISGAFWILLLFAFTGGMLLNLMPCVFPILSIKIMNFMEMAGHNRAKVRLHGWVFAAGVLASFLLLASLLLLLRAGGQELGWGFQLQSPAFIVFLTFLMFGLGLSLMGMFEIGNSLITIAGKTDTGQGLRGSFFSGILATVLATPCTAPFMGTALGMAITLPALNSLMIFLFLGAGMAFPYLLLTLFPALMKLLPKPGAWMETFKQIMAFPLFATAIWLMWVFGQQTGSDGVIRLLVGLLCLSAGIWILHRWSAFQISTSARVVSRGMMVLIIASGFMFAVTTVPDNRAYDGVKTDGYGIEWIDFSEEKMNSFPVGDAPVFIDFTAAWCITCKANERIVFSSQRVRDRFADLGFVMVKADWTNRNPEITRALASFGRNGVPFYVIYPGNGAEPVILPELLTPGIVLEALDGI